MKIIGGYNTFRGKQKEAIEALLRGEDVFFLAPTSLGKSVCYQLPSLLMDGTTIVVSPLIALMKDQTFNLDQKNIVSGTINSTTGIKSLKKIKEQLRDKSLKLLYVAPETLLNENLINFLIEEATITAIAIDECHVVSTWGNNFRPKYKQLGMLKTLFPNIPTIALTATLCPEGQQDVIDILQLNNPNIFIHNLDRPNIRPHVIYKLNEKVQLLRLLSIYKSTDCGIIYCSTKDKTEEVARFLNSKNIKCEPFHAGMKVTDKRRIQEEYVTKKLNLIVATIAFGMGIDRSDVRYVIHINTPANMENYLQEIGRNGRDGKGSESYLLYDPSDIGKTSWMIKQSIKDPVRLKINQNKLYNFKNFCEAGLCRRVLMLSYFNQKISQCNNCDICLGITSL